MALGLVGFLVCIPVFLDVALVMVLPLAVAAAKRTGRNVTVYALPMLSGMAVTHAFVPPTPGPTTVAQLLSADLGWVIALGVATGLPTLAVTAWISGTVLAKQAAGNAGRGKRIELPPIHAVMTHVWLLFAKQLPMGRPPLACERAR